MLEVYVAMLEVLPGGHAGLEIEVRHYWSQNVLWLENTPLPCSRNPQNEGCSSRGVLEGCSSSTEVRLSVVYLCCICGGGDWCRSGTAYLADCSSSAISDSHAATYTPCLPFILLVASLTPSRHWVWWTTQTAQPAFSPLAPVILSNWPPSPDMGYQWCVSALHTRKLSRGQV